MLVRERFGLIAILLLAALAVLAGAPTAAFAADAANLSTPLPAPFLLELVKDTKPIKQATPANCRKKCDVAWRTECTLKKSVCTQRQILCDSNCDSNPSTPNPLPTPPPKPKP